MTQTVMQTLESRTLMSATPADMSLSIAVQGDRAAAHADLVAYKADVLTGVSHLMADLTAAHADGLLTAASLRPTLTRVRADLQSIQVAYWADHLNESLPVQTYEAAVNADLATIAAGRGHPAAMAGLLAHHQRQLRTALSNGLYRSVAAHAKAAISLFNDGQRVADTYSGASELADAAPGTSPLRASQAARMTADLNRLTSDFHSVDATLSTDLAKLHDNRQLLAHDIAVQGG